MAHLVKCAICGKMFDRDKEQAVYHSARRYSHYECEPNKELVPMPQVDPDLLALQQYIEKLLGTEYNRARVNKQIKDFTTEYKYSYSGILKSLVYFFEIKGNSIDKANGGIGIVPFVYNDARTYYYNLFLAQSQNQTKDVQKITSKVKEITIPLPQVKIKKRMFNVEVEDE